MSHEIKRRKVVLASVLKPVDDTRMLEKIGVTLSESEEFEVFIIGYPSVLQLTQDRIHIIPLPYFSRISFKRLIIPWNILKKIGQIKPDIIIINTPELLPVTVIYKILFGSTIIYDVLENYYRNIRYSRTYPPIIKSFLAYFTRFTEVILSPFITHYFLAEKGYSRELKFANPQTVLENKLPRTLAEKHKTAHTPYYNLLFSGTLSQSTGVFNSIQLAKELHAINPAYTLTIMGYCSAPETLTEIQKQIADSTFITLKGGNRLIPHVEILTEISRAGTGIIIYPDNPGTESSIPTKLYEYLSLKLPVVISHTESSTKLIEEYNAGIVLRMPINPATLNEQLATSNFTFNIPESIFWDFQAQKLPELLKSFK